jgi:hypothetical protein
MMALNKQLICNLDGMISWMMKLLYLPEIAACQLDTTEKVNAPVFPISRCGQRNAR